LSFLAAIRRAVMTWPPAAASKGLKGADLSYSILIVDDSEEIRSQLRSYFQQNSNWKVCGEAVDGRDAIQKAEQLMPDLIILDLSMPVMNGFEAARELKHIRPQIPLVMFTTFKTPVLEKEAASAGFAAVLSKSESNSLQVLADKISVLLPAAS
jgi:DNA-binding NarL/FixJ family response regulator